MSRHRVTIEVEAKDQTSAEVMVLAAFGALADFCKDTGGQVSTKWANDVRVIAESRRSEGSTK